MINFISHKLRYNWVLHISSRVAEEMFKWQYWEPQILLVEEQIRIATLENSLAVSTKAFILMNIVLLPIYPREIYTYIL